MTWLRHLFCDWRQELIVRRDGRLYLECPLCGYQSPGIEVGQASLRSGPFVARRMAQPGHTLREPQRHVREGA
jgi:hypothetical protein